MLAIVVLGDEGCFETRRIGVDLLGEMGHVTEFFEHPGVKDRFGGVDTPGEGTVTGDQHHRDFVRIELVFAETVDDLVAGFDFVIILDALIGHQCGAGDIAAEMVGVGGAENRHGAQRLRPGHRIERMGVHDSADMGKRAVEDQMGVDVAGGAKVALHHFPVAETDDHHVLRLHAVVIDAGGLDGKDAAVAVDRADVAEGVDRQPELREFEVGLPALFAKFLIHASSFPLRAGRRGRGNGGTPSHRV